VRFSLDEFHALPFNPSPVPNCARTPLIRVSRYADGFFLRTIGSFGSGQGQMNQPWTSAIVGDGNIVVVEYGNHRVQVLRYGGPCRCRDLLSPLRSYRDGAHQRTFGTRGSGPGEFIHPTGTLALLLSLVFLSISNIFQASLSMATVATSSFSTVGTAGSRF
jgi:hypothetical protein